MINFIHITRNRIHTRVLGAGFVAMSALGAFAPVAGAQDSAPTTDQYTPPIEDFDNGGAATGGLPFTGFDVALVLAIGAALLVLGLAIRRATRSGEGTA